MIPVQIRGFFAWFLQLRSAPKPEYFFFYSKLVADLICGDFRYVEKILFLVFFWELPQRIFDKRIFCFKIRICLAKTIFLIHKMLFLIIIFAFNTMVLNPLRKSQKNSKKNFFDRLSRYKIPLFGPQKKMKNFSKTFSTWCNRQKKKKNIGCTRY